MATSTKRSHRKIFIGDVHGCYDELIHLLSNLQYNEHTDQLFFVGDLVCKGPKSNEVIEFARTHKNCRSIRGNHDYYLLTAARHVNHYPNDISEIISCKELDKPWPPSANTHHIQVVKTISLENIKYLHSLPLYLHADDDRNILVVHAGIIPDNSLELEDQSDAHLMTLRNIEIVNNAMIGTNKANQGKPWPRYYDGSHGHIFFGHDAMKSLQIGKYATGLDTGACYGDRLTAAIVACDEEFKLFDDYAKHEEEYIYGCDAEWRKESEIFISSTKKSFVYRLYSVKSHKVHQKPKGDVMNSKCIKLLDQLLFAFV